MLQAPVTAFMTFDSVGLNSLDPGKHGSDFKSIKVIISDTTSERKARKLVRHSLCVIISSEPQCWPMLCIPKPVIFTEHMFQNIVFLRFAVNFQGTNGCLYIQK